VRNITAHIGETIENPVTHDRVIFRAAARDTNGAPHTIRNAGEGEAHLRIKYQPALKTEAFFKTVFALARVGKTDAQGRPSVLQLAAGASEYGMYVTKPPISLQKALFAVLGPLARALGYTRFHGV
jgi:hypothetical protein